jgi:heme/copper-type cytochrome/quinol oxidase subunit 2
VVSLTAWTASALLMVPIIMYANIVENTSCNILWPESEHISGQAAFTLYSFILGFAIPLLLIFVFYFLVIRKLKTVGPKNKSKEKKKSHRKVTKLVLTVIAVYVLCWLPYWITQVCKTHVKESSITMHGCYLHADTEPKSCCLQPQITLRAFDLYIQGVQLKSGPLTKT